MILELKRFNKATDLGAITKASESLFITQPAMTQSIQRLEKELGFKLFKHEGKKVYLTQRGIIVKEISQKIIELWEKAQSLRDSDSMQYSIALGAFDSAALSLTEYFNKAFEDSSLELIIDRSEILLKKLRLGLIDICICILPNDKFLYSGLELFDTYVEKLIPVSSLKGTKQISDIPFILYDDNSQTGGYINEVFSKSGIKPKVVTRSVNPLFIRELALKKIGTAILPFNMIKDDLKEKRLFIQKLPFEFERTCGIFIAKESDKSQLVQVAGEIRKELMK